MSIPWNVLLGGEPAEFAMGHEPSTSDVKATVLEAVSQADAGSEGRAAGLGSGRARSGWDKAVRWRRVDLRAEVTRRFGAKVHASTAGEWLHRPGPARRARSRGHAIPGGTSRRRRHMKNLPALLKTAPLGCTAGTRRPNTAAMNARHLAEISTQAAPGAQAVLLGRAGWHQRGKRCTCRRTSPCPICPLSRVGANHPHPVLACHRNRGTVPVRLSVRPGTNSSASGS